MQIAIFSTIDLELDCTTTATLTLSTDLPGNAMAVRETKAITACTRRIFRFKLQGTTKGHRYSIKVTPASGCILQLYAGSVYARVLPGPGWAWYPIPIPSTPEEWTQVALPIPETPQAWQEVKLPIPETGEWEARKLPIPDTPEDWQAMPLPIPPTPADWSPVQLPIKPTPANPEWVNVEVDQ